MSELSEAIKKLRGMGKSAEEIEALVDLIQSVKTVPEIGFVKRAVEEALSGKDEDLHKRLDDWLMDKVRDYKKSHPVHESAVDESSKEAGGKSGAYTLKDLKEKFGIEVGSTVGYTGEFKYPSVEKAFKEEDFNHHPFDLNSSCKDVNTSEFTAVGMGEKDAVKLPTSNGMFCQELVENVEFYLDKFRKCMPESKEEAIEFNTECTAEAWRKAIKDIVGDDVGHSIYTILNVLVRNGKLGRHMLTDSKKSRYIYWVEE